MLIAIQNLSTRFSDADAQLAVGAVAHQVRYHAGPTWGITAPAVVFYPKGTTLPAGCYVIGIFDHSDQAGALGWHTEDSQGRIFGRVFVADVLDNGGTALTGSLSVSAVLSHEVLEAMVDPHVVDWSQSGSGALYAKEVGDPVENQAYVIQYNLTNVSVSNFVTPAWFDPQAPTTSRFDWLSTVHAPFTMTKGGYVVTMAAGRVSQKFGDEYPEWKKATKGSPLARTSRRTDAVEVAA